MSLLFGGKEILCDGCGSKICDAPGQIVVYPERRDELGYRWAPRRTVTVLSDVFPTDAITFTVTGFADDSGPGSPARVDGSTHVKHFRRDFCSTCAPVALDKLKEQFARLPLVDNMAERE